MPFSASGNSDPSFCEGEGEERGRGGEGREKRGSRDEFNLQAPGLSVHPQ